MRTIEIENDGEPVRVVVKQGEQAISSHVLHAVGPNGSLAYFKGGPGVAADAPRVGAGRCPTKG